MPFPHHYTPSCKYPKRVMNFTRNILWKCTSSDDASLCELQITAFTPTMDLISLKKLATIAHNQGSLPKRYLLIVFCTALPTTKRKANSVLGALIEDNLATHLNEDVMKARKSNNVRFTSLPPNATDKIQLLLMLPTSGQ